MTSKQVASFWQQNAPTWTEHSRQGWDVYRDALNTPAFLKMLPEVRGLSGLDIGCGEGHNTRLLAARGARMTAMDVAPAFLDAARHAEIGQPLGIHYASGDALNLPFGSACLDFTVAFMSLMDMPQPDVVLKEVFRVLRPGGFLQFSISHPCFFPPHRKLLRDGQGQRYAVEVGRYFDNIDGTIETWTFSAAPADVRASAKPFQVPKFHRPLSFWLNAIVKTGFTLEAVCEPHASEDLARRVPEVADTRIVAYFLHIRCRKP